MGGENVSLMVDYECLDVYGPKQRMVLFGCAVTVYNLNNARVTRKEVVPFDLVKITGAIARLQLEVAKACIHPKAKEISRPLTALRRMQCLVCGETYENDSSD